MDNEELKIYTYVDGVNDTPFPNLEEQAKIKQSSYSANRMGGVPSMTATLMYDVCLDNLWTKKQYVTYNNEKYFVFSIPTSSKDNTDTRYKHEITFTSERVILDGTYFFDVVSSGADANGYFSNSTKVTFTGNISEFVNRINYSLKASGIGDSIAHTGYYLVIDEGVSSEEVEISFENKYISEVIQEIYNTYKLPYYFVGKVCHVGYYKNKVNKVFKYGKDNGLLSITKTNANYKNINRCSGYGSSDNIPYYYPNQSEVGVPIYTLTNINQNNVGSIDLGTILAYNPNVYSDTMVFKRYYGLSETASDNYFLTNILGSTYHGTINIGHSPFVVSLNFDYKIKTAVPNSLFKFTPKFGVAIFGYKSEYICEGISTWSDDDSTPYTKLYPQDGVYDVTLTDTNYYRLRFTFKIYVDEVLKPSQSSHYFTYDVKNDTTISYYEYISNLVFEYAGGTKNILYQNSGINLVNVSSIPTDGSANIKITGRKWITPSTTLMPSIYRTSGGNERFYNALNNTYHIPNSTEYYEFKNEYVQGDPHEYIQELSDIKPTIKGITNSSGQLFGEIVDIAFDADDNDSKNSSDTYEHSYFYIKLRKFDGDYGFNLFAQAIESNPMEIDMISGVCNSCKFKINNLKKTTTVGSTKKYVFSNGIQTNSDGTLKSGNFTDKWSNDEAKLVPNQQNTQENEIWVCVQKDNSTFGVLMPNHSNNYKPSIGDKFVITNILMPQSYYIAAENKLSEAIIKYMYENNSDRFNFSITFSRIFLKDNPSIMDDINENSIITVNYAGKDWDFYVNTFTYKTDENILPEISVELKDELSVNASQLNQKLAEINGNLLETIGSIDYLAILNKYFVRKDIAENIANTMTFLKGIKIGDYNDTIGGLFTVDENGKSKLITDNLEVRMSALFNSLTIVNTNSVAGRWVVSPAGSIKISSITENPNSWTCYFSNDDGSQATQNLFSVDDLAQCKSFNIKNGTYSNVSNTYYWRRVISVGDNYVELSKTDCDTNSMTPRIGDTICQVGNVTDNTRQSMILFDSFGDKSPRITLYNGINGYSYTNKEYVDYGVDGTTKKAFFNVYGDAYIGARDGSSYIKYDMDSKKVSINATLEIGTTTSDGTTTVEQAIKDAQTNAEKTASDSLTNYAGTVTNKFNDLQSQIDGEIDSWFYQIDPTTSNEPAINWNTDELKQRHANDTYTNTNTGASWKWIQTNNIWGWTPIADTATQKALANAAKAQDTADGKRRVFTAQPTNAQAYDIGDLWVNATYGSYINDLLRCKNSKAINVAFNISDWDLASKYTDDTAANNAAEAAANAAKAAANAQTSANAANSAIADMASDDKITAQEKQAMKTEWDSIVSEKTKNDTQADSFGVSRATYDSTYSALSTTIGTNLSSLTTTWDLGSGGGATLRSQFKAYYDARTELLNNITTAAKNAAIDTAAIDTTNKVNAIQVGGRNLIIGSESSSYLSSVYIFKGSSNVYATVDGIYAKFVLSSQLSSTEILSGRLVNISQTGWITESVYIKCDGTLSNVAITFFDVTTGHHGVTATIESLGNDLYRISASYNNPNTYSIRAFDCNLTTVDATYIWFYHPKLEYGNKATSWTPAPEDVDSSISTAQQAADAAQTSANTANSVIANIVSDNILSANEKPNERSRWNDISNEKSGIESQATSYGITTELTNYNNAFQLLANYLNNGSTWSSGVPLWISDANISVNTAINGSDYRTYWNNYYNTRQLLLNAIYAKAKTLAANAYTNSRNDLAQQLGYADYNALYTDATTNGNTIIKHRYINTDLVDTKAVVTQGLSAQTINANNATISNLNVTNATVSGTLNGVSGTFSYLQGVGSNGKFWFNNAYDSMSIEDEDFRQQGTKNGRTLRYYANNIRCRGSFGASSINMARVHNTYIDYYVNGDINSYVRFNLQSNGIGGYYVPLYPSSDTGYDSVYGNAVLGDVKGFPVDLLIFDNNSVYQYEMLAGSTGKKVTVVNAHDGNIEVHLAVNGKLSWQLFGGAVQQYVNIRELMNPTVSSSVHGAGWLMVSDYDNNWA